MTTTRRSDWQTRLDAFVRDHLKTPFAWGENDCWTFAAGAVREMTDAWIQPQNLPAWHNAREAYRALQMAGGLPAVMRTAGLEEIRPPFACRGDAVLLGQKRRPGSLRGVMAICVGDRIVAPGPRGLVFVSMAEGEMAWRV